MQNLFEILGLEPRFDLDEKALEKAYFDAQRRYHPDRLIGKPEAERVEAFGLSELANDAYDTLKNPVSRAEHLLELQHIFVDGADNNNVPPSLLMEMMELRERIADHSVDGPSLLALVEEIKASAKASTKTLGEYFAAKQYQAAANETMRLNYLGKALEETYMLLYRFKATHGAHG